jgi:uroporphyrin-III C-methyltransferase/precorrin-2 dehydrogenase/sirohydrochlorin ferrochelatase
MTLSLVPADPQLARIAPLARLPVFLKLEGRRALVAGASAAAAWKAELLAAAGATVDVYAPAPSTELLVAAGRTRGIVTLHTRPWTAADFADAAIAIAACDDDDDAARFAAAARTAGVPVNVIDRPAYCDFAFGAIVNRSPLVIGISTDGAAPVFAQAIRARIETLLPQGFARWAEAAARWRPRVHALGRAVATRFWERFAARAVARAHTSPHDADLQTLLAERDNKPGNASAVVIISPDDPELLTLRAVRALQSADVILFDATVAPATLDFARREARRMLISTHGDGGTYGESAATIVTLAKAGRRVVRLIGTSIPLADAEIAACRAAGVTVEIVPSALVLPPQGEGGDSGDQQSGVRNQSSAKI